MLGVFLIYYSLKTATPQERQELLDHIVTADPKWLILSVIFGILAHLSRAYRWKFMLQPMGYKPKFINSFMAVMVGYLANFGVPRSGELLRAATLSTYEKVPFEKAFGSIISERIADFIVLLCIITIALIFQAEHLLEYFQIYNINPLFTTTALLLVMVVGILILKWIKKSKLPVFLKIKGFVKGLLEGMQSILQMKQKWAFIFHTIFIWVMYLLMFYVIVFTIPETTTLNFGAVMAAFVIGSLAISATNGGIGVYPVAIGAILVLFDISKQSGEAFGWLTWGAQTVVVLVFGTLSFIFLPVFNRQK